MSGENPTVKPAELQQAVEEAAAVLKAAGAEAVFLFGSTVQKPVRPDSDIDLAVTGLPSEKFFQTMGQILFVLPRPLDLNVDTPFTRYLKQKGNLHRVA